MRDHPRAPHIKVMLRVPPELHALAKEAARRQERSLHQLVLRSLRQTLLGETLEGDEVLEDEVRQSA